MTANPAVISIDNNLHFYVDHNCPIRPCRVFWNVLDFFFFFFCKLIKRIHFRLRISLKLSCRKFERSDWKNMTNVDRIKMSSNGKNDMIFTQLFDWGWYLVFVSFHFFPSFPRQISLWHWIENWMSRESCIFVVGHALPIFYSLFWRLSRVVSFSTKDLQQHFNFTHDPH
jgi:hypothetical protein